MACNEHYDCRECSADFDAAIAAAHDRAIRAAAKHQPMVAIDSSRVESGGCANVWIYCSCGFNEDPEIKTTDTEDWTKHILTLTHSDATAAHERELAAARLEEAESALAAVNRQLVHRLGLETPEDTARRYLDNLRMTHQTRIARLRTESNR